MYFQSTFKVIPKQFQSTTKVLPMYFQSNSKVLPKYFQSTFKVLPKYLQSTSEVLSKYFQNTSETQVLPEYFREVLRKYKNYFHFQPSFRSCFDHGRSVCIKNDQSIYYVPLLLTLNPCSSRSPHRGFLIRFPMGKPFIVVTRISISSKNITVSCDRFIILTIIEHICSQSLISGISCISTISSINR